MGRNSVFFLLSATAVLAAGCRFTPHRGTPGGGAGGTSGGGTGGMSLPDDGAVFRPDAAIEYITVDAEMEAGPTVDANCGNQPFTVIPPPADLLILLDRSGSMLWDTAGMMCGGRAGCGANSRWTLTTTAINQVVEMTQTNVNWGLKFFGNDNQCGVTAGAAVAPGPSNAMAIATAIAANPPGSATPTPAGVRSAGAYLQTVTSTNKKFILLATDGQPTCAGGDGMAADDAAAIAAVAEVAALGFPTFVIGVATGGSTADMTLSQMAMNGGYPRTGMTPLYYPVTNGAELVTALNEIQNVVMGMCTYPLGTPDANADPTKVTVTVDGAPSIRDAPDGWVYDAGMTSITFTGTTCAQLMAGTLRNVQVLYGCKVGPVM